MIGSSKTLFTIHRALVVHHSEPLGALVSGPLREAKEGCAWLEDVDEHTFSQVGQYFYTGDYKATDPAIILDSSNVPAENSNPAGELANETRFKDNVHGMDEGFGLAVEEEPVGEPGLAPLEPPVYNTLPGWNFDANLSKGYKKKKGSPMFSDGPPAAVKSKKSLLWEDFKSLSYPRSGPEFKPRKNHEACEDYTEVFLGHARLYVFADKYSIDHLRSLCLQKLHQTLVKFTLYEERVGDIVELLRYGYSNTADHTNSHDALRLLIIRYAACVVEKLLRNEDFRSLLEDPGQLAKDLVEEMLKRLD